MDFELMLNSLPKLLNATLTTLKLLSVIVFWFNNRINFCNYEGL